MIIGTCFEGDDDEELKLYQHACYYDSIGRWINLAGKLRLQYYRLQEWEDISRQWEKFREHGYHDHRTIQAHHDLIAQRFRGKYGMEQLNLIVTEDGGGKHEASKDC